MGMRTLNRKILEDDPFLRPLFGADEDEDEDEDDDDEDVKPKARPKPGDRRRVRTRKDTDDDDEDDLDGIEDPKDRRIAELSRESARRRREKNQEKRRADELETRLTQLENKGKDVTETQANELKTLRESNEKLQQQLQRATVRTAIVNNDSYKWHDVDDIYSKLDLEDIEIDPDTGEVDGLDIQLKNLAKKKPYLLRESDASGGDGNAVGRSGSTGHNPRVSGARSKGRQETAATQRENLVKKYKSLGEFAPM